MMAGFERLFQMKQVLKPAVDAYSIRKAEMFGKPNIIGRRGTCSA